MARRPVPADLEDALAANPAARDRFWSLPPEQLDRWVAWVERSRFPGQRRRRVAETVRRLAGARVAATTEVAEDRGAAVVPFPRDDVWVWLVGLALLAALAAFLVWWTTYRHHHHQTGTSAVVVTAKSTVPKVTGIRLQSAVFQLKEAKLGVKIVRRNAKKPKNIVVGQAPKADKQVVQGTVVTLVASKGPSGAKVPKLTGLAAADAIRQLQALGLTANLQQTPASGAAPGTVVQQSPTAGKRVKPGTAVRLAVAKGAAAVTVPNVVGQTQQQAANALQQQGLNVTVAQVASSQTAGTVVAQHPAANAKVQQGASVRINVAKQQATTTQQTQTTTQSQTTTQQTQTTPVQQGSGNDYRGMRLNAAVQKIAQGRQQVVVQYVTSTQPAGVVVANSTVDNKVKLQVSAGAQPQPSTSVTDETGNDQQTAQQDLTGAGFSVLVVQWPVSDQSSDGTVVYETPAGQAPKGSTIVIYVGKANG